MGEYVVWVFVKQFGKEVYNDIYLANDTLTDMHFVNDIIDAQKIHDYLKAVYLAKRIEKRKIIYIGQRFYTVILAAPIQYGKR